METTLMQILVSQSPALFLLTIFLLICFFANQKRRHALAVTELIVSLLLLILGVALYFIGISREIFTIHNFYRIQTAGWIGLAVTALLTLWILLGKLRRSSARQQEKKDAVKAANAQALAVEKARAEAFEAGRAAAHVPPAADGASAGPDAEKPPDAPVLPDEHPA